MTTTAATFGRRLRVLTLNLNIDRPSGAEGDAMVRRAVIELAPDIITFQEALWHGDDEHQGLQVLGGLGYTVVHQFDVQPRPDRYYGTVIASRWPISHSDVVKLPSTSRGRCVSEFRGIRHLSLQQWKTTA